ncbi:MAG: very short patch repair endonuclease [Thermoanaerobaculia bacterium]
MDVHDKSTRSFNMSRIRSRDTVPELRLRRFAWASGLRGYRVKTKLPGKPDMVFSKVRVAVFVDGCFWHSCPDCNDGRAPKSNLTYWSAKRRMNCERDLRQTKALEQDGWIVLRFWEHIVLKKTAACVKVIERAVRKRGAER